MLLKILSFVRRFGISVIFSLGVHSIMIVSLLYFPSNNRLITPGKTDVSLELTRVNIATLVDAQQLLQPKLSNQESLESIPKVPVVAHNIRQLSETVTKIQPVTKSEKVKHDIKSEANRKSKKEPEKENKIEGKKIKSSIIGLPSRSEGINREPVLSASPAMITGKPGLSKPKVLIKAKPEYPLRALALHIEGWVKVQYDINEMGRVTNIRVLEAKPRNLFEREVRQAMKKWRFEAVEARDYVTTVVFKMGGDSEIDE